jgi:hypothetical protein
MLVIIFVIIIVIFYCLYKNITCEKYMNADIYYCNDWNDPYNIQKINNNIRPPCKYCTYSIDCDLSDNSLPGCNCSYDEPIMINGMLHNRNL